MPKSDQKSDPSDRPLRCLPTVAYSFFRVPLSTFDFTLRPARTVVWVDKLGMPPGTQAMAIAAAKSVDLFTGFIIGAMTDACRTRWGRRKPFIAVLWPICTFCMIMFVCAPSMGFVTGSEATAAPLPCVDLVSTNSSAECPALTACLAAAIERGDLPPPNGTAALQAGLATSFGGGMFAYFILFYFFYYLSGFTGTQIPYDALGMELTDDYNSRSTLFGTKTLFQFIGYVLPNVILVGLGSSYADDTASLYALMAVVFAVIGGVAYLLLLGVVGERPPPEKKVEAMPVVPTVRAMLRNRPYVLYLAMRVPMSIFSLVPSNMALYFAKHNLRLENYVTTYSLVLVIALLSAMLFIPIQVLLAKKLGKPRACMWSLLVIGVIYIVFFFIPSPVWAANVWLAYLAGVPLGFGTSLPFVLPDSILADTIDYDELHAGIRSEGMYTVVETNLQQFTEIAGGVLPLLFLSVAGYVNLGGCKCGCGVACEAAVGMPYARWACDGSVAYTCDGGVGSPLLNFSNAFGAVDEPDAAPCAVQDEGVEWTIMAFFALIPGICAILAAVPALRMPITAPKHKEILKATAALNDGTKGDEDVVDPLTQKVVVRPDTSAAGMRQAHFSKFEWAFGANGAEVSKLKALVYGRLALWVVLIAALIAAMAATAEEFVVTLGCLALSALFILTPWEVLRIRALGGGAAKGGELNAI